MVLTIGAAECCWHVVLIVLASAAGQWCCPMLLSSLLANLASLFARRAHSFTDIIELTISSSCLYVCMSVCLCACMLECLNVKRVGGFCIVEKVPFCPLSKSFVKSLLKLLVKPLVKFLVRCVVRCGVPCGIHCEVPC